MKNKKIDVARIDFKRTLVHCDILISIIIKKKYYGKTRKILLFAKTTHKIFLNIEMRAAFLYLEICE